MRANGGIDRFAALLVEAGLELGAEEMADALWLAGHISPGVTEQVAEEENIEEESTKPTVREEYLDSKLEDDEDDFQLPLSLPQKQGSGSAKPDGIPIKAPAAPALRIRLELARALRPLRRRVPSPVREEFDQAATIERVADQGIWSPVLSPAPERWLEVALVIEESKSAPLWKETLAEFQTMLERQGAFRNVSPWRLKSDETGELTLLSGRSSRPRSARELLDPAGRRLILVVSDCTSTAWQWGAIYPWLEIWSEQAPMTVIQLLPERLWAQTGLACGVPIWLSSLEPGMPSAQMMATAQIPLWDLFGTEQKQITIPVVSLEAEPLKQWAKAMTGVDECRTVGFRFEKRENLGDPIQDSEEPPKLSAEERVRLFRATASLTAQKLAGLMSAVPVSPPIVNLLRQTMLPEAEPVHVAEVYMGGLMEAQAEDQYDFLPEIRDILANTVSGTDIERVLDSVSAYISKRLGLSTHSFEALLCVNFSPDTADELLIPFAQVAKRILQRISNDYIIMPKQASTNIDIGKQPRISDVKELHHWIPTLKTFNFREATIEFEDQSEIQAEVERYDLTSREAEVWKLRQRGFSFRQISEQLSISLNTVKKHLKNIYVKIDRVENEISPEDFTKNEMSVWELSQSGYKLEEISKDLGLEIGQIIKHISNIVNKVSSEKSLRTLIVIGYKELDHETSISNLFELERKALNFKSVLEAYQYASVNHRLDILVQPSLDELISQLDRCSYSLLFYSGLGQYVSNDNQLFLSPEHPVKSAELARLLSQYLIKVAVVDTSWLLKGDSKEQEYKPLQVFAQELIDNNIIPTVLAVKDFLIDNDAQKFCQSFVYYLAEYQSVRKALIFAEQHMHLQVREVDRFQSVLRVASSFDGNISSFIPDTLQKLLDESFTALQSNDYVVSVRELGDDGLVWPIARGFMYIGRLPDNDLVVSEPWVSSKHAEIFYRRISESKDSLPTYFLRDYSRYGTYYLSPQGWRQIHRQEISLSSGMQLRFGSSDGCLLEFLIEPKLSEE